MCIETVKVYRRLVFHFGAIMTAFMYYTFINLEFKKIIETLLDIDFYLEAIGLFTFGYFMLYIIFLKSYKNDKNT